MEVSAPSSRSPRDEGAAQAILTAAMELLAEVGFAGVTVDAVAQRAGVGKATIYRRWQSKERLVLDAIERVDRAGAGARHRLGGRRPRGDLRPDGRVALAARVAQPADGDGGAGDGRRRRP